MLVLSRKVGQKIMIGDGITLFVKRIAGQRVVLGVEAPPEITIVRSELTLRVERAGLVEKAGVFEASADVRTRLPR